MVAALIAYHAYLTGPRQQRSWVAAIAGITVLAFLSKESTSILVLLLPALYLTVPANELRRSRTEALLPIAITAALGLAFVVAMELHEYTQPGHANTLGMHMARNLWRYLKWMVLPFRPGQALGLREALAGTFLAAGVVAFLLRQRVLSFLFAWTIVGIMPFTGFGDWIEFRYTYVPTLPFVAFVVCGSLLVLKALPRGLSIAACSIFVLAAATALIVAPMRTRDEQANFAAQAAGYKQMVDAVSNLCGRMPPDSYVYVLAAPYQDLWHIHTRAALNLYYQHLDAVTVDRVPPLAAFIQNKCVIQYDAQAGRYFRVE